MAMDPREDLLNRASKLAINSVANDGKTTVDSLLEELRSGDKPTILAKVDGLRFGSAAKTLQQEVDERVALHDPTGRFGDLGLASDERIGAFHKVLQNAEKKGASKGVTVPPYVTAFANDVLDLYKDGILDSPNIKVAEIRSDLSAGLPKVIDELSELGATISDLQAEIVRVRAEQEKEEKKRRSALGATGARDPDEGMGLFE